MDTGTILNSITFVDIEGFKIKVDRGRYSDTMVTALENGTYEIAERTFARQFFKRGDRVLEVGSSIGMMSMFVASVVGPANFIGYEANPELMPDASDNFRINGLDIFYHNFVLRNRVRGGGGGTIPFYINRDFWTSSLMASGNTIRTVDVQVQCLEEQIQNFGANALFLDIEGGEADLLLYADLTGIDKIFMEVHYWPSRKDINKMLRYLSLEGFSIDHESSSGFIVAMHRGLVPK